MRKALRLATVAMLAGGTMAIASPAAAVTVVFNDGSGTLPAGSEIIENFNDGTSTFTGGQIFAASQEGIAADPAVGAGDPFFAVLGGEEADYTFANPLGQFSFILGSADTYNTLTVFLAGGGSQTFTGQQLIDSGVADGDQSAPRTNGRLIVNGEGTAITGFRLASSQNSFEIDDIAGVAAVPEPATWAMMLFGFGAVGFGMRRRKGKEKLRVRYAL